MLKQRDNRQKYGFSLFIPAWLLLSGANPTQIANSKWIAEDIWSLNNQFECALNTIYLYTEVCCGSWRTLEAIQKSTSFSTIFCICCHPRENRNPMLIHFVWFMLKKPHEISPRSLSLIRVLISITVTGYFFRFSSRSFVRNHHARTTEPVSRVLQNNGIDVYVLKDTSATIVKQVSPKNKR